MYSDQPYLVKAKDGAWVCAMTTGTGREGDTGQHVISQRSLDCGETRTDRVAVEPPEGPEASWAVLAVAPGGRIFCLYDRALSVSQAVGRCRARRRG